MKYPCYPNTFYKCPCGEPIEPTETHCLSCHNEYENKYGPDVFHFGTVGYEDGLILVQDPKGEIHLITPETYASLENQNLVWYSCRGVYEIRKPK